MTQQDPYSPQQNNPYGPNDPNSAPVPPYGTPPIPTPPIPTAPIPTPPIPTPPNVSPLGPPPPAYGPPTQPETTPGYGTPPPPPTYGPPTQPETTPGLGTPPPPTYVPPTQPGTTPGYGAPTYNPNQPPTAQSFSTYNASSGPVAVRPKRNMGLFIVIGVVAIALIGGGITAAVLLSGNNGGGGGGGGGSRSPEAAVRGYLEALAAGDSAKALSFAQTTPDDLTFLTDEILAASNAKNPITITSIKVDDPSSTYAEVIANYNIGAQVVNAKFWVERFDKDYKLNSVAVKVDLSFTYVKDIGMKINGVSLDGQKLTNAYLFPGIYTVTIDNPILALDKETFTITDPSDYPDTYFRIDISSEGQTMLAAATAAKLSGCLKEQETMTTCGFGSTTPTNNGKPIDINKSTIQWTVTDGKADYSGVTFNYSSYDGDTIATAYNYISIRSDLFDTAGKSYWKTYSVSAVKCDFSDPNNIVVKFGN